jgi:hypothetical protein
MKQRALIAGREIFDIILYKPASLITLLRGKEGSQRKPKYGIELPASIRTIQDEAVGKLGNF